VRALAFDVEHFHTLWTPLMPWQLYRRLAGTLPRIVATFHDTPPPTLSVAILRSAYRIMSRRLSLRLDAMVAVSASSAAHLRSRDGCPIVELPPCIDLEPYLALPDRDPGQLHPSILFVGRLEPRKGVLRLIEAFARVRAKHPDARLIVCGGGEQLAAARKLATDLGTSSAVRFTGPLDDAEKLRLYSQATVFCAPSPYGESYGLVIAEAMAAGLPVVAAANPGYRSVLQGEGAEGLVAPDDAAALADGLLRVLASEERRRRLSAWGRANARRSDVAARLPEFLSLYRSNSLGRG
jgi:phosphatidylinositol alpha-mannosyltransferase